MTTKEKVNHKCNCCDRIWSKKYSLDRHLGRKKITKMPLKSLEMPLKSLEMPLKSLEMPLKSLEMPLIGLEMPLNVLECRKTNKIVPEKPILTTFHCDYCQFTCKTKKESEKHRKSKQHVKNENKEEDFIEIVNRYTCIKCDKCYNIYASCWKHSKTCQVKKENVVIEIEEPTQPCIIDESCYATRTEANCIPIQVTTDEANIQVSFDDTKTTSEMISKDLLKEVCEILVNKLTENNQNNQNAIVKIVETMSQSQNQQTMIQANSNNNITNNTVNHCTINMFLNEKCKDALNITDWVNGLVIDFEHLHYNAENGFQKGLTKMLIDNLKLYNVCKRPIHFTDVKRDTMYIKDADEWTKHDNNEKLIEVLESSARQGISCFADWMEENAPAYHDLDSQLGKQYMAIHQNVIRPEKERLKAYPKVMKEVARAVQLRKDDQQ